MGRQSKSKKRPSPKPELQDRQEGPSSSTARDVWKRYGVLAVCGVLLLAVAEIFGQTVRHEFVNYDDDFYVFKNPHIRDGLTSTGIVWAITADYASNWHPLTWLSHMLDMQLYGLNAGGHHLTNVMLHAISAILSCSWRYGE